MNRSGHDGLSLPYLFSSVFIRGQIAFSKKVNINTISIIIFLILASQLIEQQLILLKNGRLADIQYRYGHNRTHYNYFIRISMVNVHNFQEQ